MGIRRLAIRAATDVMLAIALCAARGNACADDSTPPAPPSAPAAATPAAAAAPPSTPDASGAASGATTPAPAPAPPLTPDASGAASGASTPAPAPAESAGAPAAGGLVGRNAPAPDTPPARIAAELRKGDRVAALKIADDFLVEHPRDAQVRFLRAVVLGDMGRIKEATSVLESLTEDFPELAEPYNNLAVIHANQGQLATAEHDLLLAVTAQPNYVTARENLGDLYISMAAAAYEQATHLDPGSAALKKKLALARELSVKLHGEH